MRPYVLALLCLPILALPAQAQWDLQDSHTTTSLRGIHNVGGGVAWASGTNGTVLRTEDGGYLWQTCATPPGAEHLDFRGIQAFDENTAIVMSSGKGDLSRLYKTTDGCKSWKLVFTNPDKDGFWDAIQFYQGQVYDQDSKTNRLISAQSRTTGMLLGDPVNGFLSVFSTHDGATWHRWGEDAGTRAPKANPGEAIFAASNTSLVSPGINGQYVFVTGGKSGARLLFEQGHSPFDRMAFSSVSVGLPSGETAGAFSVARREADHGTGNFVIVGGDYKMPDRGAAAFAFQPTFLKSVLVRPAQTPPHGYRGAVAYDEKTKTWITVGPNGTDISTDDGKNWRALHPKPGQPVDSDKNWNALSLPFVVGPNGRIGKLRDDALKP
jgi:photosystem II stability/assembly factor-like uncharacterized protein